jgi:hypothetical protein
MSCDICGRGSCTPMFHSSDEQRRFEKVIEAFERARELRAQVNEELDEEARNEESQEAERVGKGSPAFGRSLLTAGLGGNFKDSGMELRQQLEKWSEQVSDVGTDAAADMDVAKRLLKHGIEALNEIERLRGALKTANKQAEHFEREWYLRGDAIEALLACPSGMYCDAYPAAEKQARALLVPNVELRGAHGKR